MRYISTDTRDAIHSTIGVIVGALLTYVMYAVVILPVLDAALLVCALVTVALGLHLCLEAIRGLLYGDRTAQI